jgi:hypothetical protein
MVPRHREEGKKKFLSQPEIEPRLKKKRRKIETLREKNVEVVFRRVKSK